MSYLVITRYTPEYPDDQGVDLDYFDTLKQAQAYAKGLNAKIYMEVPA